MAALVNLGEFKESNVFARRLRGNKVDYFKFVRRNIRQECEDRDIVYPGQSPGGGGGTLVTLRHRVIY